MSRLLFFFVIFIRSSAGFNLADQSASNSQHQETGTLEESEFHQLTGFTNETYKSYLRFLDTLNALAEQKLGPAPKHVPTSDQPIRPVEEGKVPLFEGDIALTPEQVTSIVVNAAAQKPNGRLRTKRKFTTYPGAKWTLPIPYVITSAPKSAVKNALNLWETATCVKFQEVKTQPTAFLEFIRGQGCYSAVGKTGFKQQISIGIGCERPGVAAHEVGHALGFWHEQSRPDRDNFVNIIRSHIIAGTEGNFLERSYSDVTLFGIPYDIGSVMHYGPTAFTNGGDDDYTIEADDKNFQHTMGQRAGLSFYDVKFINIAYCADKCETDLPCENDGYTDPNDCSKCVCPDGLTGLCNEAAFATRRCGEINLMATSDWQTISMSLTASCAYYIKAPEGKKILLETTDYKFFCATTCEFHYLEIKYSKNLGNTGARFCCDKPAAITTESNEALVIYHGFWNTRFALRFRFDPQDLSTESVPVQTTTTEIAATTSQPIIGEWQTWETWSGCSRSCGACGARFRVRRCSADKCPPANHYEVERCGFNPCPTKKEKCIEKFIAWCKTEYCIKSREVPCEDLGVPCCIPYHRKNDRCVIDRMK